MQSRVGSTGFRRRFRRRFEALVQSQVLGSTGFGEGLGGFGAEPG